MHNTDRQSAQIISPVVPRHPDRSVQQVGKGGDGGYRELPESIIQERRRFVGSGCFSGCAAGFRLPVDKRITRLLVVRVGRRLYRGSGSCVGDVVRVGVSLSSAISRLPTATTSAASSTFVGSSESIDDRRKRWIPIVRLWWRVRARIENSWLPLVSPSKAESIAANELATIPPIPRRSMSKSILTITRPPSAEHCSVRGPLSNARFYSRQTVDISSR